MATSRRAERMAGKRAYMESIQALASDFPMILVSFEGATSAMVAQVRKALRPLDAVLKGGKNTLMKKALGQSHPFVPFIRGQVGLVFLKDPIRMTSVVSTLLAHSTQRPARVGDVPTTPIILPMGQTGCAPSMTAHFQAMGVPTMINKGQVSVTRPTTITGAGEIVTETAAHLCTIAGLTPFKTAVVPLKTLTHDEGVKEVTVGETPINLSLANVMDAAISASREARDLYPGSTGGLDALRMVAALEGAVEKWRAEQGGSSHNGGEGGGGGEETESESEEEAAVIDDIFGGMDDDW